MADISKITLLNNTTYNIKDATSRELLNEIASEEIVYGPDSILSFHTPTPTPLNNLMINIEPVQDLHGYDHPWPAGGGKNKFHFGASRASYTWSDGSSFADIHDNDAFVVINGTATSNHSFSVIGGKFYLDAGDYAVSITTNNAIQFRVYNKNSAAICDVRAGTAQFTIAEGQYCTYDLAILPGTYSNLKIGIQIEAGSTATAWSPYSNICPISGWTGAEIEQTGRNWFDISQFAEQYPNYCTYSNDTLTVNTNSVLFNTGIDCFIPAGAVLNATITPGSAVNVRLRLINSDGTILDLAQYQMPRRLVKDVVCVRLNWSSGGSVFISNACAVSVETVAEWEYVPYTGNQISVTFPSEAGTIYGGTVTLNPDRTGTLLVDRAKMELNGAEVRVLINGSSETINVFRVGIPLKFDPSKDQVSNYLKYNRNAWNVTINAPYSFVAGRNEAFCQIPLAVAPTVQDFRNYLNENNFVFVGTLVEPQTYQLTADQVSGILTSLYGTNNIWSDAGDVTTTLKGAIGSLSDRISKIETWAPTVFINSTQPSSPNAGDVWFKIVS